MAPHRNENGAGKGLRRLTTRLVALGCGREVRSIAAVMINRNLELGFLSFLLCALYLVLCALFFYISLSHFFIRSNNYKVLSTKYKAQRLGPVTQQESAVSSPQPAVYRHCRAHVVDVGPASQSR